LGLSGNSNGAAIAERRVREKSLGYRYLKARHCILKKRRNLQDRALLRDANGRECVILYEFSPSGVCRILEINGLSFTFSGDNEALVISYQNMPGMSAELATLFSWYGINAGKFRTSNRPKSQLALISAEIDREIHPELLTKLKNLPHIYGILQIPSKN
jgi:L-serine dehydratase